MNCSGRSFYAAVARHLIGQGDLAVRSLQERIRPVKYAVAGSSSRLASYLTFLRLLSGDLFAAARDAVRTVDTATHDGSPLIEGTGPRADLSQARGEQSEAGGKKSRRVGNLGDPANRLDPYNITYLIFALFRGIRGAWVHAKL